MKRKFWTVLFALAAILCLCLGLASCGIDSSDGSSSSDGGGSWSGDSEKDPDDVWTIERVYAQAQELGFEGSLEDLIALFKGEAGQDGQDGVTPHIGENGNWFFGELDTGVRAAAISIKNITIDDTGRVVITMDDGTVYTVDIDDNSCPHETFTESKVDPTCEERGYTRYTCTKCGYSYINDYVPETGHYYYNGTCVWCEGAEPFDGPQSSTEWYNASEKTFEIKTPEDLAGLAHLVNTGTNFSGKTVSLANNIALAGVEWVPIGRASAPFAGTFDGRNFTVSGLKISNQTEYVGLFGNVTGAISNVKLTGANITVTTENVKNYVGILCGYTTNAISGVTASGFVTAENCNYVGGIVGFTGGTLTDCTNAADVTGISYVGGIAGSLSRTSSYILSNLNNSGTVSAGGDYAGGVIGHLIDNMSGYGNCTVRLEIMTNTGAVSGASYVGGFFGYLYTNSQDSVSVIGAEFRNSGNVTASGNYAGGFFGYAASDSESSVIERSESKAVVSGNAYVGGLAGYLGTIALRDCSNAGSSVTAAGYEYINSVPYAYLGGYVGCGYSVTGCDNAVTVDYTARGNCVGGIAGFTAGTLTDCTNTADVTGQAYVGGIAGSLIKTGSYTLSNLKNGGNVTARGDYAGGIIGHLNDYLSGYGTCVLRIEIMTNTGAVSGASYVGGILGYLYGDSRDSVTIIGKEFRSSGSVTASGDYVGGVIGYASSDGASTVESSEVELPNASGEHVDHYIGEAKNFTVEIFS